MNTYQKYQDLVKKGQITHRLALKLAVTENDEAAGQKAFQESQRLWDEADALLNPAQKNLLIIISERYEFKDFRGAREGWTNFVRSFA